MADGTGMASRSGSWVTARPGANTWAGPRAASRTAMLTLHTFALHAFAFAVFATLTLHTLTLLALVAFALEALTLHTLPFQAFTLAEGLSARHRRANGTQRQHKSRDGETASEHFRTLPG